jgi:hypothetical protein
MDGDGPKVATATDDRQDEVRALLAVLPHRIHAAAEDLPPDDLLEVVMDLRRKPEARLTTWKRRAPAASLTATWWFTRTPAPPAPPSKRPMPIDTSPAEIV